MVDEQPNAVYVVLEEDSPFEKVDTNAANVTTTAFVSVPDSPWDEEIDSSQAAELLGVNLNHLRQIVFKKKLTPVGKKGRRASFRKSDVLALKSVRESKRGTQGEDRND